MKHYCRCRHKGLYWETMCSLQGWQWTMSASQEVPWTLCTWQSWWHHHRQGPLSHL